MDQILEILEDKPQVIIATLAVAGGMVIAVLSIVTKGMVSMTKAHARERTRSEIAAYVAEGSMTPEVGERLLEAGKGSRSGKSCWAWWCC